MKRNILCKVIIATLFFSNLAFAKEFKAECEAPQGSLQIELDLKTNQEADTLLISNTVTGETLRYVRPMDKKPIIHYTFMDAVVDNLKPIGAGLAGFVIGFRAGVYIIWDVLSVPAFTPVFISGGVGFWAGHKIVADAISSKRACSIITGEDYITSQGFARVQ